MANVHRITPCLWFDDQAEQAARFFGVSWQVVPRVLPKLMSDCFRARGRTGTRRGSRRSAQEIGRAHV